MKSKSDVKSHSDVKSIKKQNQYIVILMLLGLLLACQSGCGKKREDDSVQTTLRTLSSTAYEGRLYGTKGNEKARDYLEQKLEAYGFAPFADAFQIPFETSLPVIRATSLSVSQTGGGKSDGISFVEGKDYFSSLIMPQLELSGTVPQVSGKGDKREMSVICAGGITLTLKISQFRLSNSTKLFGQEEFKDYTLGVSAETMDELCARTGETVTFRCEGAMEEMTLQNVVGVLKGKDSSRAVVLGAHFDHMGTIGDALYAGAVDNASGAATLLAACRELAAKGQKPQVDIIACFWNAEEEGLQGSKAGAPMIERAYGQYCYINLDCVGMVDGGNLELTTANASGAFCAQLAQMLEEAGCGDVEPDGEPMTSDHRSFQKCPSVNIGQGDVMKLIHTPRDTADQVDGEKLEQLAAGLSGLVFADAKKLLDLEAQVAKERRETEEEIQSEEDWEAYLRDIERSLDYDEYMLVKDQGNGYGPRAGNRIVESLKGRYFQDQNEVQKVYPNLRVAERVGDYRLVQILVQSDLVHVPGQADVPVGQPTKRLFQEDAILCVQLFYDNGTHAFTYTRPIDPENQKIRLSLPAGERKEKIKGSKGAWFVYYDQQKEKPDEYIQQTGATCYFLTQGKLWQDEDGICLGCIDQTEDADEAKDTLFGLGKLVNAQEWLVALGGE